MAVAEILAVLSAHIDGARLSCTAGGGVAFTTMSFMQVQPLVLVALNCKL